MLHQDSVSTEDMEDNPAPGPSRTKRKKKQQSDSEGNEVQQSQEISELTVKDICKNDYVIVRYEGAQFPGIVVSVKPRKKEFEVRTMTKGLKYWKWNETEKPGVYKLDEIVKKIKKPTAVSNRGVFRVEEMESIWGN